MPNDFILREKIRSYGNVLYELQSRGNTIGHLEGEECGSFFVLNLLHVFEEHRGKGFGKMAIKELARNYKKPIVLFAPVEEAIHLYKKMGFRELPFSLTRLKKLSRSERRLIRTIKNKYQLTKDPLFKELLGNIMYSRWRKLIKTE